MSAPEPYWLYRGGIWYAIGEAKAAMARGEGMVSVDANALVESLEELLDYRTKDALSRGLS